MSIKLLALATAFGMATMTLLTRISLEFWPPGIIGAVSRLVPLAMLTPWILARGDDWRRLAAHGLGRWIAVVAVSSIALHLLFFASLQYTTATNHALFYRLDIVFVVLIGSALGLERIGWRELSMLPVMLLGIALVAEVGGSSFQPHWGGDLMVIGAALCLAIDAFIARQLLKTLSVELVALVLMFFPCLGCTGFMLVQGELPAMGDRLWDPRAWFWVLMLGVMSTFLLLAYYAVLQRMPVWRLRIWMLLAPVIVAVVDAAFWHTRLSAQQWIGVGLVLLGLVGIVYLELHARATRRCAGPAKRSS